MNFQSMSIDDVKRHFRQITEGTPHALMKIEKPSAFNGNQIRVTTFYVPNNDSRFTEDCFESQEKVGSSKRKRLSERGFEVMRETGASGCHRLNLKAAEKVILKSKEHFKASSAKE
jgi:hypothetical protein